MLVENSVLYEEEKKTNVIEVSDIKPEIESLRWRWSHVLMSGGIMLMLLTITKMGLERGRLLAGGK